jgi:glycosyltransferase involved in cell wall biosynthesis
VELGALSTLAIVTELFPPSLGGQEFRFYNIAKTLISKNIKVDVYTIGGNNQLPEEIVDGIRVLRYITLAKYVKDGSRYIFPLLKYVKKTHDLLSKIVNEYDAIIINEMPIAHLLYLPNSISKSVIIDVCEIYRIGVLKFLVDVSLKKFRKFTTVSDYISDYIKSLIKMPSKVWVVRTPLNISKYFADPNKKEPGLILYAGRLVKHKGILELIRAVIKARERAKQNKWKLLIIGKGPLAQVIREYAIKYPDIIEYAGYVDELTKIEYLKKAWLLAIPSKREGFPNIVAEAIASSTPVLTIESQFSSLPAEIRRYNVGIVCRSNDENMLSRCLSQVNESLWFTLMENTRKLAPKFDSENVLKIMLNIINEEALARR